MSPTSHQHSHEHHHDHAGHSHTPQVSGDNERRIFLAMLLTGGFMVVEVIGGLLSGSLARAAHTDSTAARCWPRLSMASR
jgi:cobalt-zinc-cadmium efflux system protein